MLSIFRCIEPSLICNSFYVQYILLRKIKNIFVKNSDFLSTSLRYTKYKISKKYILTPLSKIYRHKNRKFVPVESLFVFINMSLSSPNWIYLLAKTESFFSVGVHIFLCVAHTCNYFPVNPSHLLLHRT